VGALVSAIAELTFPWEAAATPAARAIDDLRISRREGLVGMGLFPICCGLSVVYSFGRLSMMRLALPSERSSVSGATALTRAVMPMVFLI
jgi:hypothetical protein